MIHETFMKKIYKQHYLDNFVNNLWFSHLKILFNLLIKKNKKKFSDNKLHL